MATHITNVNSNRHIHKFDSEAVQQIPKHPYKKELQAFLHAKPATTEQNDSHVNLYDALIKFSDLDDVDERDECFRSLIGQIRLIFPNLFDEKQLKDLRYFAKAFGYKNEANILIRLASIIPTPQSSKQKLIEEDKYLSVLFYQLAKMVKYCYATDIEGGYIHNNKLGEILEKSPELSYLTLHNTNPRIHMLDLLNVLSNSNLSQDQAVNHIKKGIDKGIQDSTYANIVGFGGTGLSIFLILALSTGGVLGSQTSALSGFVTSIGTSGSIATGFASGAGVGISYSTILYNLLKSPNFLKLSSKAHDFNQINRVVSPLVMNDSGQNDNLNEFFENDENTTENPHNRGTNTNNSKSNTHNKGAEIIRRPAEILRDRLHNMLSHSRSVTPEPPESAEDMV
jgi:hypothetical protein